MLEGKVCLYPTLPPETEAIHDILQIQPSGRQPVFLCGGFPSLKAFNNASLFKLHVGALQEAPVTSGARRGARH
jgi:hypothetical protein